MTSYVTLCTAQKGRDFAALSMPRSLPEEDETFRIYYEPEVLHLIYLVFFNQVTWGQVTRVTSPL